MGTLRITRPGGFLVRDTRGDYTVSIDDREAGRLTLGKEAVFELPAGEHKVEISRKWCEPAVVLVTIPEAGEKRFLTRYVPNGVLPPLLQLRDVDAPPPKKLGFVKTFQALLKTVPVTMALIALLAFMFTLEMCFNIGRLDAFSPSLRTLVAMGGLYHPVVVGGDWARIFSPVLLHASVIHLVMNSYALLLAGILLENMIGRIWYLVTFLVGGVAGSLMSLAINPANLISVGASGAIMALFAAALASSFHRPPDASRKRFQLSLGQILFFALVPYIGVGRGQHIDIAAHLGGIVAGSVLGGLLVLAWAHRRKPWFRQAGLALVLLFGAGYVYAEIPVVEQYRTFVLGAEVIPENRLPHSDEEARKDAKALGADYPNDPRSHLYLSMVDMAANDMAGAERELRAGLAEDEMLRLEFRPMLRVHMEGVLALVLLQRGDTAEAKRYAAPLCASSEDAQFRQNLVKDHLCD